MSWSNWVFAGDQKLDSLFTALKQAKNDTSRINVFFEIGLHFQKSNPDSAFHYYEKGLRVAEDSKNELKRGNALVKMGWCHVLKGDYDKGVAIFNDVLAVADKEIAKKRSMYQAKKLKTAALSNIGTSHAYRADYQKALDYYLLSLDIEEELGNNEDLANTLGGIGAVYLAQGNYPKALEYLLRSINFDEKAGNKQGIARNSINIGIVYQSLEEYQKALEYYEKALKISQELGNKYYVAANYGNIGIVYKKQREYTKALKNYELALAMNEELGMKSGITGNLSNIGNIYFEQLDEDYKQQGLSPALRFDKSKEYFTRAVDVAREIGNKSHLSLNLGNLGHLYLKFSKYGEAEKLILEALSISKEIGSLELIKSQEEFLFTLYQNTGRYQLALEHYKNFIAARDSILNEANTKKLVQLEMQSEFDKREATAKLEQENKDAIVRAEQEKKDAIANKELERQTMQRNAFIGGFALMLVLAGLAYRSYRNKKKANLLIAEQKQEVEMQKHIIEEKHREITDSINYAQRIQRSFLATKEQLDAHLGDYFVYFNPKEAVSGDFYWASQLRNGHFAVCCADSTGHGVPGAIMSILNISSLEKAIEAESSPEQILAKTRSTIIERLRKDGSAEGGRDGMDCALVVFGPERDQIQSALANNPLWIIRNGECIEFKPDKMPVGKHDRQDASFTLHTASLQPGDQVYIFSDGYADQFGGDKGKKFKSANLQKILLNVAHEAMPRQKELLHEAFENWKGQMEQIDDVCVIGVRV